MVANLAHSFLMGIIGTEHSTLKRNQKFYQTLQNFNQ